MALDVLEEKSSSARRSFGIAAFGDAVCDFGNFENRTGFGLDPFELTRAVERRDPLAKVVEGQGVPLCDRRL
jgi:hypothetical protein